MFAKLTNGKLIPCSKQGRDGRGGLHMDLPKYYTENPHRAAEDGYCPVRFTEKPQKDSAVCRTLQSGEIVQARPAYEPMPEAVDGILTQLERIEDSLRSISVLIGTFNKTG